MAATRDQSTTFVFVNYQLMLAGCLLAGHPCAILRSVACAIRKPASECQQHDQELESPSRRAPNHDTRVILERVFDGRFEDKDHAISVFNTHNNTVKAEVPADRLCVYETGSGWEPLCEFLGVSVPDEPFPHTNTTAQFNEPGRWKRR